jgi:inner membrane protein involved in colicin E2 resistance
MNGCAISLKYFHESVCTSFGQLFKMKAHVIVPRGRNSHVDFKCTWKGSGFELLTPITSNEDEQKFNKNLEL